MKNTEGDDDGTTRGPAVSFHFANPIAPPRPDRFGVLEATRDDSQDEDRLRRKMADNGGVDEEANNYSDESLGEQCNNTSDCEQPNTEGSINNTDSDGEQPNIAIEGEHPMEENADAASTPTENAESRAITESTPIEVYGGSDAQCQPIPQAYLVESEMARSGPSWQRWTLLARSLYQAEPLQPWYKRRWGRAMILLVVVLVCALVGVGVYAAVGGWREGNAQPEEELELTEDIPSSFPSLAPSYDPSPTLEIVRSRGAIRCGLDKVATSSSIVLAFREYRIDMVSRSFSRIDFL